MERKPASALFLVSAFALGAICVVVGPARAASGSDTANVFAHIEAVEVDDLALYRGAGLDTAAGAHEGEDRLAVILWDEFKPRVAAGSVSLDSGIGSSLTSSISGTAQ